MTKQLQKKSKSSLKVNLKLCIIKLIRSGYNIRQICRELNIKESAISYHVSTLKRLGNIRKIGYGSWEYVKDFSPKQLQKTSTVAPKKGGYLNKNKFEVVSEDTIRGHAFVIRFKIKRNIKNWDKRYEVIKKRFKELKPRELNGGVSIRFKGRKIHLWNGSIVIYETKSFMAKVAGTARSTALYDMQQLLKSLERKLTVRETFTINNRYKFTVSREHYSMVKNALAKQFDRENKKLQIYNEGGYWMAIDNSYNLHEWEILKNREDTAVIDSEALQDFWNDHKEHNFKVTPSFTLEMMNGIQQNQLVFDKNMTSHLNVLNKIGDEIGNLTDAINKEIGKIGKAIKKLSKKIK